MEKLVKLLNEYEKEKEKSEGLSMYTWEIITGCPIARSNYSDNLLDISEPLIYGKSYGFIKWLVENDKIDLEELDYEIRKYNSYIDSHGYYDALLMLLSIQDNPLDFLVKILK